LDQWTFCSLFVLLYFLPLTFVLSVLRLTDSYYPFGIFKLFWLQQRNLTKIISLIYVYKTIEQLLKIQILVQTDDIYGWDKQDIIEYLHLKRLNKFKKINKEYSKGVFCQFVHKLGCHFLPFIHIYSYIWLLIYS
jgi:hypothetical protein